MKIGEFLNSLKNINLDDDYVSVQFAGNYSGSIRDVKVENTKVILSAEHKPDGFTLGFFDLYNKIEEIAKSADDGYDVVYYVPSKGTYNVERVEKNHYDYSEDGDGVYDCCDIYCSDEVVSDSYEDFFESLLKIKNKQMNETMDGKYAAACFRAGRVIASFYKEYGKEMTKMAFERELEDIDF